MECLLHDAVWSDPADFEGREYGHRGYVCAFAWRCIQLAGDSDVLDPGCSLLDPCCTLPCHWLYREIRVFHRFRVELCFGWVGGYALSTPLMLLKEFSFLSGGSPPPNRHTSSAFMAHTTPPPQPPNGPTETFCGRKSTFKNTWPQATAESCLPRRTAEVRARSQIPDPTSFSKQICCTPKHPPAALCLHSLFNDFVCGAAWVGAWLPLWFQPPPLPLFVGVGQVLCCRPTNGCLPFSFRMHPTLVAKSWHVCCLLLISMHSPVLCQNVDHLCCGLHFASLCCLGGLSNPRWHSTSHIPSHHC